MKLFTYITIVVFIAIAGCSDDEISKPETQSSKESPLGHYADSVKQAEAVKNLQQEAEKKKKESSGSI